MPFGFVFDEMNQALYPFQVPPGLSAELVIYGMEDHYIWLLEDWYQGKFYTFDLDGIQVSIVKDEKTCNWSTRYRSLVGYGTVEIVTDNAGKQSGNGDRL